MKNSKKSTRQGRPDLSLNQRQEIFRMRSHGRSMQKIAEIVSCAKSTVWETLNHEVLKQHSAALPWYEKGKLVHDAVRGSRGRPRSRGWRLKNEQIRGYVCEQLADKHAPRTISKKIGKALPGMSISAEAIYQYIYHVDRTLIQYLVRCGNTKRNNRASGNTSRLREAEIAKRRLDERSEEANTRVELGHLESDFAVSCRGGKSCLLVAADRKARRIALRKTPDREANTARRTLFGIFNALPAAARKSLTVDNDKAHNHLPQLESVFSEQQLEVFFCDPYSPWQRGTVEAIIGILRRWFPKGTNFDDVSEEFIQYVEDWFNNRPMEVLDGRTPNEVFEEELRAAA